jgi:hypothetical protein
MIIQRKAEDNITIHQENTCYRRKRFIAESAHETFTIENTTTSDYFKNKLTGDK